MRRFLSVVAAYLIACGVAAVGLGVHLAILAAVSSDLPVTGIKSAIEAVLGMVGGIGMLFLFLCLSAWPGFLVMRLLLWVLRRTDWPSFAVAGALNAVMVVVLMTWDQGFTVAQFVKYPPSPVVPLIGCIAGIAACLAERYFLQKASQAAATA
ncbi:hypothetical protein [Tabrizicola sp.]|uniref:hypothetical protein n=1 Tax=Tabrizicola sp. TaxID=2005166 RepID=UPI00286AA74C|nr:hypothetical protein [Tabrizicola sp.]